MTTTIANRMRLVTESAVELRAAQDAVFQSAQTARQPLAATAELYQRIAANQKALNLSGKGVASITDTISKSLAISGASAASANAALIQLGQAFASGTLRGEELNSVMEQAPALSQAIAAGMGVTVGQLRSLGAEGKLTAEAVVKALQDQADAVDEKFSRIATAIGGSLQVAGNTLTRFVGEFDQATGTTAAFANGIIGASKIVDTFTGDADALASTVKNVGAVMGGVGAASAVLLASKLGTALYASRAAKAANIAQAESAVNAARANQIAAQSAVVRAEREALAARGTAVQTQMSIQLAQARMAEAGATTALGGAQATLRTASAGLLSVLGGPVGLALLVGTMAASYFLFRDGANAATSALIDQNGTLDDSIQKFKELSAEQQRFQSSKWVEAQESALDSASSALAEYATRGSQAFNSLGMSGVESAEAFSVMVAEVKAGTRTLDSVTEWVAKNNQIMPAFKSMLEQTAAAYSANGEKAEKYGKLLAQSSGVTTSATTETEKLAAAQKAAAESSGAKAGEWDKYIAKLTETRDLIGANSAAEAEYNAVKMGASVEQRTQAKLIGEQTVVLKALQEAVKDGDKVEQAALKTKLLGLYTAEEAAKQAAATQKQAYADTATAAEESAKRQAAAFMAVAAASYAPVMANPNPKKLSGYGLLTNGGTPPAVVPEVPETALERYERAIKLINEGTEANKKTDKAANAAAKAIESQAKALKDFEAQSAISTKSSNDMADAYLAGADNVRELSIQQKIEQETLKLGADAHDAVAAAVRKEADAKDRLDITQSIASMRTETTQTLAQATATLQGKDALEAFNIQKSMTVALAGRNIEVGSKEYQLLLDQTKAQLDANKALEQAGQVEGIVDRLNPQIKLLKDFTAEQEALNAAIARYPENAALYQDALAKLGNEYEVNRSKATLWGQMTEGAIDRIDEAFATAWGNIGSGAESLWDNLKKGFKQTLGEIAHMLTTKPLLASISNWLTGTDNGQGVGSVWSKLLGGGGGGGGGGASDSNGWGGMVSLGKNLYSAWSNLTGVGSSIASGYASGGISGALSGGAGYYGNMLSSLGSTLSGGFSSIVSSITGTAAASTAATTGATSALGGALSGAVAEGAASIGTNIGIAGATTAAASNGIGAAISSAMSSAAAMWPLAIIMGMYQSGKLYSAGVRPDASAMWESGGGTALGKAAMLPQTVGAKYFEIVDGAMGKLVGGKMAAILSGSTLFQAVWSKVGSKLFGSGYKTKDVGIELGVDGGVFDAQQYVKQKKKGGLISGSSKTRYLHNPLDAETQDALGAAFNDKILNSMGLFSALGVELSDSVLDGLNMAATRISTQGKTSEAIQEELDKWFSGLGDSAVSAINAATNSGLENYNFETLTTFVNNLYSVNDAFTMLGLKLYDVSVSTGFMAEQLVAMAGGAEAFNAANSKFFDSFYTDVEKTNYTLATVTKQFKAMDVALPGSRAAFRSVVDALDLTTESGRKMYVTLTGLAESASQAYTILEQQLMSAATNAQGAVQRAISAQQKRATEAYNATNTSLSDMVSTVTESVNGLNSVSSSLSTALRALRGDSDDAVKMLRAQAQATLQSALATARSGKSLSGFTGLEDALDTVSNNNTDLYGSMEDFARDQGRTANVVAELNGINGKQLTAAEKSLKGLEDQIKQAKDSYDLQMAQYDQQLEFAQAQMDALNGVDTSVMGVTAAINAMNAAVVAALGTIGGKASAATPQNNATAVESIYQSVLKRGTKGDEAGAAFWAAQLQSGALGYEQIAAAIAQGALGNGAESAATKANAGKFLGIPGYASGGDFGGGLRLVGENGPELEVTGPSRIFNANQTAAMIKGGGNDSATVAELRGLRAEMQSNFEYIGRHIKATAEHTGEMNESGIQVVGTVDTKAVAA
ncbi:tape measure protein [Pseudomonas lundensis]|uniref:tape measure protein n=1 Tax=Pseudomonas lundensis TaxID=86185 RepID=UPI0023787D69|nr:tape measure protein [Pseudomonas lundensis]